MALFRKLLLKKPPDGLLEISERVYLFDCCFTTDALEKKDYTVYVGRIMGELRDHYPDASILVFNFREEHIESQIGNVLSEYDMTIMDYPRHYEGCPLLSMEVIHHFLRSCESWLSLGQQNVLLMHCEQGGWPVLAFMLAALLIYRKQYTGEQRTLDMIYKQAPHGLLHLLSPLNPIPSQLRYLQYVSRRNVAAEWPPLDRALTLDCVIIRLIPNFDEQDGCRPIFRIYGPTPLADSDRTPKLLFSTLKNSKCVRHYRQGESELVKIDINCAIQGDVVLECISMPNDMKREEMMFRVMFNTVFIRSNILIVNRDEIDILWDAKDHFPKDFRAEVIFSDMDAASIVVPGNLSCFEEKDGLPMETFAKVDDIFHSVDWLTPKADAALNILHQITTANTVQEKPNTHSDSHQSVEAVAKCLEDYLHAPDSPLQKVEESKRDLQPSPLPPKTPLQAPHLRKPLHDSAGQCVASPFPSPMPFHLSTPEPTSIVPLSLVKPRPQIASPNTLLPASSSPSTALENETPIPSPPPPPSQSFTNNSSASYIARPAPPPPPTPPPPPPTPPPPPPSSLSFNDKTTMMSVPSPPPPPPPPPLSSHPTKDESKTKTIPCPAPPPPPAQLPSSAMSSRGKQPLSAPSTPPPPPLPTQPFKDKPSTRAPSPPPPPAPGSSSTFSETSNKKSVHVPSVPSPPSLSKPSSSAPPTPAPPFSSSSSLKGRGLSRTINPRNNQMKKLKPLHWLKLNRAVQGSLWAEAQKSGEASKAPEIDMSELENLFSAADTNLDRGGSNQRSRALLRKKTEKVQLIEHRRAYNCEIMLSKVKVPLHELMNSVLALEDSALDDDPIDNLKKFCPTKEEMELLKGYNGEKEKLGKCEQFFLELMQVPRAGSKLEVFSFKRKFRYQVSDLRNNLNVVNSAAEQIRNSAKFKKVMQTILSLGNALNQGTARGSAVGFRLDSLLKLTETRARNNKMTLMHYLCKVLADKLPELLDFSKDLSSLEPAAKIQWKCLADEMKAISRGLEKVVQELSMCENDGFISVGFHKRLQEFLSFAEAEVRSLTLLYAGAGRNGDALVLYFGEDPARCTSEQVFSTLLNFVRMFNRAHEENCKQIELDKKKAQREAESEKFKKSTPPKNPETLLQSLQKSVK